MRAKAIFSITRRWAVPSRRFFLIFSVGQCFGWWQSSSPHEVEVYHFLEAQIGISVKIAGMKSLYSIGALHIPLCDGIGYGVAKTIKRSRLVRPPVDYDESCVLREQRIPDRHQIFGRLWPRGKFSWYLFGHINCRHSKTKGCCAALPSMKNYGRRCCLEYVGCCATNWNKNSKGRCCGTHVKYHDDTSNNELYRVVIYFWAISVKLITFYTRLTKRSSGGSQLINTCHLVYPFWSGQFAAFMYDESGRHRVFTNTLLSCIHNLYFAVFLNQ